MEFPSALDPLRSLKAVWSAVRASPAAIGGWWAIGLCSGVLIYGGFWVTSLVFIGAGNAVAEREAMLFGGAFFVLAVLFGLVFFVAQCWWRIGLENVLADTLRTGKSQLADAWKPRGRLLSVIGTHFLAALVLVVLYLPLLVVLVPLGFLTSDQEALGALLTVPLVGLWFVAFAYVGLGLAFAPFAAALDGDGPVSALRRSWSAARGRRLALLWFWIATILFALAGFLLLCVGYLATSALLLLMPAEAWLALTRGEERAGWWISTGGRAGEAVERVPGAPAP